ncbi:MAG: glycosyltransferase family 4 protein [bacterium]
MGTLQGKKILSIYYKHKPGGLCKRLYMMFDALVEDGAEVHYIAAEPYPISHPKIVPHLLWVPFKNKDGIFFWVYFFCITPFYTLFIARRIKIDMVSVFGAVYGFPVIFLKVFLQIPILIFVRADPSAIGEMLGQAKWRLCVERRIASFALRWSNHIVTVNNPLKKIMSQRFKIDPDKITVLFNNIKDQPKKLGESTYLRNKLGLDKAAFVILTMAVLDQRKNIELLVRSSEFLNGPVVFLILGEGPEKIRLEQLAQTTRNNAKIIFSGWQLKTADFLRASDLFVLPSKHEGCSNALLEALSFGLPCLASDIPENREILTSDELLFGTSDTKILSDKLNRVINNSHYLERIKAHSERARQRFLFDWEKAIVQVHAEALL